MFLAPGQYLGLFFVADREDQCERRQVEGLGEDEEIGDGHRLPDPLLKFGDDRPVERVPQFGASVREALCAESAATVVDEPLSCAGHFTADSVGDSLVPVQVLFHSGTVSAAN